MAQAARDLADVVRRCLCHEAMEMKVAGRRRNGGDGPKALPAGDKATHAASPAKRVSSIPFIRTINGRRKDARKRFDEPQAVNLCLTYGRWIFRLRGSMTMAMKQAFCAYCGEYKLTEKEHVVPQSLAPVELWDRCQWILVPACSECNRGFSADESDFRGFAVLLNAPYFP